MPQNKKERIVFALITVLITVPCFVFYCLSIESKGLINVDVIYGLKLIPIELVLAFSCAYFIVSPIALKLALKKVNPKDNSHVIVETAIVCTTACLMCPLMTFLATVLYTGIFPSIKDPNFELVNFFKYFIPNFLQSFVQNLPFALVSQVFFIQPLVRNVFKKIFNK